MAKKEASAKSNAVRILRDVHVDGITYRPDEVVEFADASALIADGAADAHPDAVAYALSIGATPRKHP